MSEIKPNIIIRQLEIGQMANFNYIVGDPETGKAACIDPGDETDILLAEAHKEKLEIVAILLTHGHYDHVGGVNELCAQLAIPAYLSRHEANHYTPDCKRLLTVLDNEKILIGNLTFECIHTPGHSPGCQCFYAAGHLFTGDTLFIDAIGRTDLQGGNTQQIFHSLQRIKRLPGSTEVWPGHNYGAYSHQNLSALCRNNPYLACDSLEVFMEMAG